MSINTYSTIREMKGRFLNMERVKKKIWKVLLMIPVLLLFSGSVLVCQASEIEATAESTMETSTAASQEAATEEPTTEVRKATPGDAWYSSIVGKTDNAPKTLDDIYVVAFWTLLFLGIQVLINLFEFIFNAF